MLAERAATTSGHSSLASGPLDLGCLTPSDHTQAPSVYRLAPRRLQYRGVAIS